MKLTKKNYFSAKNTFLSSHKIKDYLLSPQYFKAKHIDKTLVEEPTDAMHIGSMTEMLIENDGFKKLCKIYNVVARRDKKIDDPRIQVTETMFMEANNLASAIKSTQAFNELKGFKKQVILTSKTENLCGMIDYLKITDDGKAIIVDLKTSRTVDERKYWYQAEDLGYFIQAACYVRLVKENYLDIDDVSFYHLTVEKDAKGINKVKVFLFPYKKISDTIHEILVIIDEIEKRTDWSQDVVSLTNPVLLTNPKNREVDEMESMGDLPL